MTREMPENPILGEYANAERAWTKTLKRLKHANRDIGERAKSHLEIEYAPKRDYLYVTLTKNRSDLAAADYLDSDAAFEVAYYDPQSFVIGGFDVPFFLERSAERSFTDFWSLVAAYFHKSSSNEDDAIQRYEPNASEAKQLAAALQAVVDQAA